MNLSAPNEEVKNGVDSWINKSLWRAKCWLDSRGLKKAPEKTEAMLVTDRKYIQ